MQLLKLVFLLLGQANDPSVTKNAITPKTTPLMLTMNFEKASMIDIIIITGNKIVLNTNLIINSSLYLFALSTILSHNLDDNLKS